MITRHFNQTYINTDAKIRPKLIKSWKEKQIFRLLPSKIHDKKVMGQEKARNMSEFAMKSGVENIYFV